MGLIRTGAHQPAWVWAAALVLASLYWRVASDSGVFSWSAMLLLLLGVWGLYVFLLKTGKDIQFLVTLRVYKDTVVFYIHMLFCVLGEVAMLRFPDFNTFWTKHIYWKYARNRYFFRSVHGPVGKRLTVFDYATQCWRGCLNFGSYNYLGLQGSTLPWHKVLLRVERPYELASDALRQELCADLAKFTGKPYVYVTTMGYAVNALVLPRLFPKGALVLSDAKNHASLIDGLRSTKGEEHGVKVKPFAHCDWNALETQLKKAEAGQEVWVVIEGVYSTSGTIVDLPGCLALKKKYNFTLVVDEAHSFGVLGASGRGVSEHYKLSLDCIDVLIGTFSKTFNAAGGMLATSRELGQRIAVPAVIERAVTAFPRMTVIHLREAVKWVDTAAGKARLARVHSIANYLYDQCAAFGFPPMGTRGSPVVSVSPVWFPKAFEWSQRLLIHGFGVVLVGYPASDLFSMITRLCVAGYHTEADVDKLMLAWTGGNAPVSPIEKFVPNVPATPTVLSHGVGTAGPRGFYGNLTAFQHLESQMARTTQLDTATMLADTYLGPRHSLEIIMKCHDRVYLDPKLSKEDADLVHQALRFTGKSHHGNTIEVVKELTEGTLLIANTAEDSERHRPCCLLLGEPVACNNATYAIVRPTPVLGSMLCASSNFYKMYHLKLRSYVFSAAPPAFIVDAWRQHLGWSASY